MKDLLVFLYFGFIEERSDKVLACVLAVFNAIIGAITLTLFVIGLDYLYKVDHQEKLPVIKKVYHEDYYYNTLVGDVMTLQYSPERFELEFEGVSCTVNERDYNQSSVGDNKVVSYYTGLTNMTYCTNVK